MSVSFDRGAVGSSPLAVGLLHLADSVEALVAPGAGRVDCSEAQPRELAALVQLMGVVLNQLMLVLLCLLNECERRGVAQGLAGMRKTEQWLAAALRLDGGRAGMLMKQARLLHATDAARSLTEPELDVPCPRAAGMASGLLSVEHVRRISLILEELSRYDGASRKVLDVAEHELVHAARILSPEDLAVLGKRLREDLAPAPADRPTADPARLRDLCGLSLRPHARTDGALTELTALITAEMKASILAVIEPLSAPLGTAELPDPRSSQQRALDALLEVVTFAGRNLPNKQADGPDNDADVDVDMDVGADGADRVTGQPAAPQALDLAGLPAVPETFRGRVAAPSRDGLLIALTFEDLRAAETGEPMPGADRAAQILSTTATGQRISVSEARRLACEARIIPVVLDGEGRAIDVGRAKRLATPDQRRLMALRDKGCVGPGCDRPPDWSQAHHLTPWTLGGRTNLDQMRLLCLWHHHLVHDEGWDLRATEAGGTEWRAPAWIDPTRAWVRTR
ncbi:MAG: DUF222 domain-containing protein [Motilibacteraceae bacterium]